ncbi:hypothetical protein BC826DRAFT_1179476 [Russula brevipes]|nr:hypothetical protein BC826DRAFT_1179476 [Russula brevipes]
MAWLGPAYLGLAWPGSRPEAGLGTPLVVIIFIIRPPRVEILSLPRQSWCKDERRGRAEEHCMRTAKQPREQRHAKHGKTKQLICKKVSLEGELLVAEVRQTIEGRTQEIDDHHVIVAFSTKSAHKMDTNIRNACALSTISHAGAPDARHSIPSRPQPTLDTTPPPLQANAIAPNPFS